MHELLDEVDQAIVTALQENARQSNKELAARIGLAPSSCLVRVRRLLERGVLRGFHAEVDPKALGVGLVAMISIRLRQHARNVVEDFRRHVIALPEVVNVYHLAGDEDFLVQVAVRDADHLRDLVMDGFTRRSEIANMQTALVFEHYRARATPLYAQQSAPSTPPPPPRRRRRNR